MSDYSNIDDLLSNEEGFSLEVTYEHTSGEFIATLRDEEGSILASRTGVTVALAMDSLELANF